MTTFNDFACADDNVEVVGDFFDQEIVDMVLNANNEEGSDNETFQEEESEVAAPQPTVTDAQNAIEVLRNFAVFNENGDSVFQHLSALEQHVSFIRDSKMVQKDIRSYFTT